MAEKMILSLPVNPARRAELVGIMNSALTETRAYAGNLGAEAWVPEHDDGLLWVFEHWETRDHQGAYFAWRVETGMVDMLGPFLTGPPQVIWLQQP